MVTVEEVEEVDVGSDTESTRSGMPDLKSLSEEDVPPPPSKFEIEDDVNFPRLITGMREKLGRGKWGRIPKKRLCKMDMSSG